MAEETELERGQAVVEPDHESPSDAVAQATTATQPEPEPVVEDPRMQPNEKGCPPVRIAEGNSCRNCGWEFGKSPEPHAVYA